MERSRTVITVCNNGVCKRIDSKNQPQKVEEMKHIMQKELDQMNRLMQAFNPFFRDPFFERKPFFERNRERLKEDNRFKKADKAKLLKDTYNQLKKKDREMKLTHIF